MVKNTGILEGEEIINPQMIEKNKKKKRKCLSSILTLIFSILYVQEIVYLMCRTDEVSKSNS